MDDADWLAKAVRQQQAALRSMLTLIALDELPTDLLAEDAGQLDQVDILLSHVGAGHTVRG